MSGYLRLCLTSLVLVGALAATPAFSNPFADFFGNASREPAASPPVQAECLPRPGDSPGAGQHWVYRRDGHRKCWFLAEGVTRVQKPAHRRAANRGANPDQNDAARLRRSPVVDARAELQRSAPAEGVQPPPPAREVKVADAALVVGTGTTAVMPAAPFTALPTGQFTSEHSVPFQIDVEKPLAAVRDAAAASVPPAIPVGMPPAEAGDGGKGWTATWLGLLLMVLGIGSVLSSSRVLREAVLLRS
ncbi:hypothetical protein IVB14_13990 [Bradyrhizobium sp. 180]|uniref:hypothetical protein n=1 Tax=unclassified Bradyrhizobium TaxID=2631580 RepID=UPI001FF7A94A|nr:MULTISPECIES: hypothetical protein [unclassified Bradyrhizobium]MCK1420826.1 hypothetical protein [Bradyrhizobium sp. CW12]MCK1491496.1 hypothetical protein [Bradyrhizobium sp. 180]MCK1527269.1 hypothetical protein [Bradyrhizobium sp. 182]MCK1596072.1 hypothetical protein [Bradyrhizobium sp. 164]MCK1648853.1 hypothetical protein [Bradyrhizobium sp. 154]